jgi:hypothetical protein
VVAHVMDGRCPLKLAGGPVLVQDAAGVDLHDGCVAGCVVPFCVVEGL